MSSPSTSRRLETTNINSMTTAQFNSISLSIAVGVMVGCGKSSPPPTDTTASKHEHKPPHAGTAIELGNEQYHIELVRDATAGKLTAYILDGELENFVRITAPAILMNATFPGRVESLRLQAIANSVTGEHLGDTSQFEAQGEWIKTVNTFDGIFPHLQIRSANFTNVAFNFPAGNEK